MTREGISVMPVTLHGEWVRLEPIATAHIDDLAEVGLDSQIWTYFPMKLETRGDVERWVTAAMEETVAGGDITLATIERASGKAIGSTRFMDIRPGHRAVEIGGTWLGPRWWRTVMNSEAKYLQLRHLFDTAGCIRVCWKTDVLNARSRRNIERLGAKQEGILRKHMIVRDGRVRDSVYYSILDEEWPAIRARMESELYGPRPG